MISDSDLCVIIRRLGESLLRERADFVRLCAGLTVIYLGTYWGLSFYVYEYILAIDC